MEEELTQLASDVGELHTQYQAVWRENQELRNAVGFLGSKCDYLENQSRRNNLLFLGFPAVPAGTEHFDECEGKGKEAIREGMGKKEDILIERAHRSGKAIVAKFLSYKQKTTVLTQARKLNQSVTFKNIYVREDFSETVQRKRKEQMSLQREMRQNGQPSKLRFDKLVTDRAIFTYDLDRQEVRREDNRRRHGGSGPSTKQDGGLVHAPASNNRWGAVTDVNTRRSTVDHVLSTAASGDTEPTTGEFDQQSRCHRQYASNAPTEPADWKRHPHWYPEASRQHGTKAAEFDIQPTSSWWHHEYHC